MEFLNIIKSQNYENSKILNKLIKNFAYNLKDFLNEKNDENRKFDINIENYKIRFFLKISEIPEILNLNLFFSKIDLKEKLILQNRNFLYVIKRKINKNIGIYELNGFCDPVQILGEFFIKNSQMILKLIISNIAGVLIQNFNLEIFLSQNEKSEKIGKIEIPNFATKNFKIFFYEINLKNFSTIFFNFETNIKNVEKNDINILSQKKNEENMKIDKNEEDLYDFDTNFYIFTKNIKIPFFQLFHRIEKDFDFYNFLSKNFSFYKIFQIFEENFDKLVFVDSLDLKGGLKDGFQLYKFCYDSVFFMVKVVKKEDVCVIEVKTHCEELMEIFMDFFYEDF